MLARYARSWLLMLLTAAWPAGLTAADWQAELRRADPQYSQMPFWFWNDELSDQETARQMAEFRRQGVQAFVIHARMGLPAEIPYMGARWLGHVRFAVEEAARTGMRVCLYDEGMYPSGSAHGAVVRSNPAFAAQGLLAESQTVVGPAEIDIPTPTEDALVAAVLLPEPAPGQALDLKQSRLIERPAEKLQLTAGRWRLMRFVAVPSRGTIRGVHPGEESGKPSAPAAADLLNPEAMRTFLKCAYEPYWDTLKEHFGSTVIGIFTDEPSLLGRSPRKGVRPWTPGLPEYFRSRRGYALLPMLPALFADCGEQTEALRQDFELTLAERLDESYYQQLSHWCAEHRVALTGHPGGSDEIRPLRLFQIPGQDIVWRWVVPDSPTALEGVNSTVAKCSSSVARHDQRRRNLDELYGAYGWQLTMDEMKWLADWMLVRGVNLLSPHAFYYSIREERVNERPPDLGLHNAWWPHYRPFADYTTRLCGLVSEGRQVCDVAVLSVNNRLPWRAAKWLLQNQVDFNYLEDWRLVEQAQVEGRRLRVGPMSYALLIVDDDRMPQGKTLQKIRQLQAAGVLVRHCSGEPSAALVAKLPRDLETDRPLPGLRYAHLVRHDVHHYLLTNEGEEPIEASITCQAQGHAQWYDPWYDRFSPAAGKCIGKSTVLPMRLERRQTLVLCIDPATPRQAAPVPAPRATAKQIALTGPWTVATAGGKALGTQLPGPADAAETLRFETSFEAAPADGQGYQLDLGRVGDWALVRLNGQDLGPRFWAPFQWDLSQALRPGPNRLQVDVVPSLANRYDRKHARPAGLFGPVRVVLQKPLPVVVCLGDSITHGAGLPHGHRYPDVLESLLPGTKVINAGIGGKTSQQGMARLETDVLAFQPRWVVMLFGTNDSVLTAPGRFKVPLEQYEKNLRELVDRCRQKNARVVLCTLPAIVPEPYFTRHPKEYYEPQGGLEKLLRDYRAAVQRVAQTTGSPMVDLYEIFRQDLSLLRPDGVHPEPAGAKRIAEMVADKLRSEL